MPSRRSTASRPLRSPLRRTGVALLGLLLSGLAAAQALLSVDLPAQPLDAAINQLARQANVQVVFAAPLAAGRTAPALKGQFTARAALERLLAGTGLTLRTEGAQTYVIESDAGQQTLPTVRVKGNAETATGVVDGYVARRSLTATKTDTDLARTPQAISVVSAQQIADQNALSVAEALRYTGGIFTEYRGASNLHDEMVLRGFLYAPRYLNGLLYGSGSLGQIDPYLLERVEVLRGPASVLYGQSSPGGIVNLVSKKPDAAAPHEVLIGTGNRGRAVLGLDVGGAIDENLSWRLVANAEKVDTQEQHLQQRRFSLSPSLSWKVGSRTDLQVQAVLQHEPDAGFRNFGEAAGMLTATKFGFIPRNFLVSDPNYDNSTRDQKSLGYQFSHRFDDGLVFRQNLRLNKIDSDYRTLIWNSLQADEETITRMASGGSENMHQAQVDNLLQWDFNSGGVAHKLLAGLDLRHTRRDYAWGMNRSSTPSINWRNPVYNVSSVTLSPTSEDRTTAHQTGLYVQDQIEIGALSLLIGGRQDWAKTDIDDRLYKSKSGYDDRAFTGRAGAVYALGGGWSPYVSYSTSFEPVLESAPQGQAAFKPSRGKQVEAGVKYAPQRSPFGFSAAVYDLSQTNVVNYDYATQRSYQTGEVRSHGIELEGHAELGSDWKLLASYSRTDSEVKASVDTSAVGKAPARIPKGQASLWAHYEQKRGPLAGVGAGVGVRRVGASQGDSSNSFQVSGVTLVDVSLSFDLAQWSQSLSGLKFQLNAANLSDKTFVASCASRWACFYGNGRVVTASARYAW